MIRFAENWPDFVKKITEGNFKIVCFGAGAMGKTVLDDERIADRIIGFCDNDVKKQDTFIKSRTGRSCRVEAPSDLITGMCHGERTVVLITSTFWEIICEQLSAFPNGETINYAVFPLIKYNKTYDKKEYREERLVEVSRGEYRDYLLDHKVCEKERTILIGKEDALLKGEEGKEAPLVIPSVTLSTHNRCNLKCIGCAQLLPCFKDAEDYDFNSVIEELELFFESIDQCIRLTVDGEPFIYPRLAELLRWLCNNDKLVSIVLFTNGICRPDHDTLVALSDPKVCVKISDYGMIVPMSRMVFAFEEAGICFDILSEQEWEDWGNTAPRGRSEDELSRSYLGCEAQVKCKMLSDGKLFCCNRAARMHALNCGYESGRDYFTLKDYSSDERRVKIAEMYLSQIADACDRCDAGQKNLRKIQAGEQPGKKLRSKYTLVRRTDI